MIGALVAGVLMANPFLLDEFEAGEHGWRTVNDGVMGGRSDGRLNVEDGVLVFTGVIRTRGGGFASARRQVAPGTLGRGMRLHMPHRSDGRGYELIFQTAEKAFGLPVTYRVPLEEAGAAGGLALSEELAGEMTATVRGRRVDAAPFDPASVREIGIILADGEDGPFRLEIEKVALWPVGSGPDHP